MEREPIEGGGNERVLAVFLTNRECPWHCVFCDLWRFTLTKPVSAGDIPAQLNHVFSQPEVRYGRPKTIKLYNAGSFFDSGAIPPDDDCRLAEQCSGFRRVIVESHPRLVGSRCWAFRDGLRRASREGGTVLEVAMGLETVEPGVLESLNKGVTVDGFAAAAGDLKREEVSFRAFVLVQPPFSNVDRAVYWAVESVRWAFERGARMVSLIPVRGGNGALEALRHEGRFTPPTLGKLECALEEALKLGLGLVQADLWDLGRLADCAACFEGRVSRLERMNLVQRIVPRESCSHCGWGE